MKKIALFNFSADLGVFAHVMINAVDMKERGYEVKIVIETKGARFVRDMMDEKTPFATLYRKVRDRGLIDGVCRFCASMADSQEAAKKQGLRLIDDINGHPSIARYLEDGFTVLIF